MNDVFIKISMKPNFLLSSLVGCERDRDIDGYKEKKRINIEI